MNNTTCPLCNGDLIEGDLFGGEPVFRCKVLQSPPSNSVHYVRFGEWSDYSTNGGVTLIRDLRNNTTKIKHDGYIIQKMGETSFDDILSVLSKWQKLIVML